MVNSTTISSSPNPKSSPKLPPEKLAAPPQKGVAPPEKVVVGRPKNAPSPRRIREVNSRYNQPALSSSSLSSSFSSNSSSSSSMSSRRSKTEEVSNAARVLSSMRRLSVSFQGEAFKLPVSKVAAKPAPVKGTVERGRGSSGVKDHVESGKIGEAYRWPGRSKGMNSSFLTRSLDFGSDKSKLFGSGNRVNDKCNKGSKMKSDSVKGFEAQCVGDNANFGSVLVKSDDFVVDNGVCKKGGRLKKDFEAQSVDDDANRGSVLVKSGDSVVSDSDTASLGSNVGRSGSVGKVRGGKRGIVVPARFLQDANSRVRKEVEVGVGTPKSKTNESKVKGPFTPMGAKMYSPQTPVSLSKVASVSGRFVSPVRGGTRVASISKRVGSPVNSPSPRGRPSPTRTRNGMPNVPRDNATPSILSFTADMRRVRVGESRVNDAHELRMLYNRQLQWRFINAKVEAALLVQSGIAERSLYNAWVTISKLRHSNRSKRIQLQQLRHNLKLYSILKGQAPYLESWSLIDSDHCISLSEARQALQNSIANLPLVDGARADIELLKNAINSAAVVMQGITLSVGSQLMMVEQVSSLASELAITTASEISLIDQGKNLLSALNALQAYECSLNTHLVQLPHEASSIATPV